MSNLDLANIRKDFPILNKKINGKNLVYLDNSATTHRPKQVLNAIRKYNEEVNASPHRGAYGLSVASTDEYERSRERVREFINAGSQKEIIFTRNATEGLNLLAYSYGMAFIEEGDEIVLSITNHHSNILPWQQVAKVKGAKIRYVYLNQEGLTSIHEVKEKITSRTKLVSIPHIANALGTINPVKEIIDIAHKSGSVVIVDGAQSVPHLKTDVRELDSDFFVFSGHKMLGPMGIGVVYGKEELLNKMPPFLTGGDMIEYVWEDSATFAEVPGKFEAGTQNVEGAIGLRAAIDYIDSIGIENIYEHEKELTAYAMEKMLKLPYIDIFGPKNIDKRGGIISFNIKDAHPHDVASIVDTYGVALRAGHHCAQPLMKHLNLPAVARVSFYLYNTKEEVDIFIESIKNVRKWLGYGS